MSLLGSSPHSNARAIGEAEAELAALGLAVKSGSAISAHPEIADIVRGVIPAALGMLFAPPSAGKTLVAIDLAMHVALGLPWLGQRTTQGSILYVATESQTGINRRFIAKAQSMGLPMPDNLRIIGGDASLRITEPKHMAVLESLMVSLGSGGVAIIDTLSNATAGINENDSGAYAEQLTKLIGLCQRTGWAVLLVHHSTKASGGKSGALVERGSGAIRSRRCSSSTRSCSSPRTRRSTNAWWTATAQTSAWRWPRCLRRTRPGRCRP
ncbi:AAA family ATPase [Roseateles sp. GG27B]